jgi:hypothetical protein
VSPAIRVAIKSESALDHADLPNSEDLAVRLENTQRVSGDIENVWDQREVIDPTTHHLLSLKTIFELRRQPAALRIGQIIFDPNGEYANENAQDAGER